MRCKGSLDTTLEEEEEKPEVVVEFSLYYMEVKTNREHGKQETRLTNRVPPDSLYFRY